MSPNSFIKLPTLLNGSKYYNNLLSYFFQRYKRKINYFCVTSDFFPIYFKCSKLRFAVTLPLSISTHSILKDLFRDLVDPRELNSSIILADFILDLEESLSSFAEHSLNVLPCLSLFTSVFMFIFLFFLCSAFFFFVQHFCKIRFLVCFWGTEWGFRWSHCTGLKSNLLQGCCLHIVQTKQMRWKSERG